SKTITNSGHGSNNYPPDPNQDPPPPQSSTWDSSTTSPFHDSGTPGLDTFGWTGAAPWVVPGWAGGYQSVFALQSDLAAPIGTGPIVNRHGLTIEGTGLTNQTPDFEGTFLSQSVTDTAQPPTVTGMGIIGTAQAQAHQTLSGTSGG